MTQFLTRQILLSIPTTIFLTIFVFGLIYLLPGDPAEAMLGQTASPEAIQAYRAKMRLDQPFAVQYLSWFAQVLQGDLGRSVRTSQPVLDAIVARIPVTFQLAFYTMIIALALGIPTGLISAIKRNTMWDLMTQILALIGISTPGFFLAILLILLFALRLRLLPAAGYVAFSDNPLQSIRSFILPALSLGLALIGAISRMTRAATLDVLSESYIVTAHAKGLRQYVVILRHALKNALIPIVTLSSLQLGFVLGGTIIIESIFGLPGLGRLMIDNINGRDFPMVQGVVLFLALVQLVLNLCTDLIYAYLNPQVRYQ